MQYVVRRYLSKIFDLRLMVYVASISLENVFMISLKFVIDGLIWFVF